MYLKILISESHFNCFLIEYTIIKKLSMKQRKTFHIVYNKNIENKVLFSFNLTILNLNQKLIMPILENLIVERENAINMVKDPKIEEKKQEIESYI